MKRSCVICHKSLKNLYTDGFKSPVSGGVIMYTSGQFGSRVFDHSTLQLEICLCDGCLKANAEYVNTCYIKPSPPVVHYTPGIEQECKKVKRKC